jgi:hypothetical protein
VKLGELSRRIREARISELGRELRGGSHAVEVVVGCSAFLSMVDGLLMPFFCFSHYIIVYNLSDGAR